MSLIPERRALPLVVVLLAAGCASTDADTTESGAFSFTTRVQHELAGEPYDHAGLHLEGAWDSAGGEDGGFDYRLNTLSAGVAFDDHPNDPVSWTGVAMGLAWRHARIDAPGRGLDVPDGLGPYVAVQGGWSGSPHFEPFGRVQVAGYLPDLGYEWLLEAGVRIPVVEHAAFSGALRYTHTVVGDLDDPQDAIDRIELDRFGLVLGLDLWF